MLPKKIPLFPLSNLILFPRINVPLNIFEERYIQMIDNAMKSNRLIGIIQPKKSGEFKRPDLYNVGCAGKIISFSETNDGRYLIVLNGVCRFKIISEIENKKLYREFNINFDHFKNDLIENPKEINVTDNEFILNKLKSFFEKQGYSINIEEYNHLKFEEVINNFSMSSPFTLEEKQMLIETINLFDRKKKLEEILNTYAVDNIINKTLQ